MFSGATHNMLDAREEFGCRLPLPRKDGNLMLISLLFQSSIPFPTIGMDNTAGLNRFFYERLQTARGRVSDSRHPYSSGAFSVFLGCNHYQHLFLRLPSPQPLFRGSHISLVNLGSARQSVMSGGGPWHDAICAAMSKQSRNSSGREPVASREHWLLSSEMSPTRSTDTPSSEAYVYGEKWFQPSQMFGKSNLRTQSVPGVHAQPLVCPHRGHI